jgi:hypothetical protein
MHIYKTTAINNIDVSFKPLIFKFNTNNQLLLCPQILNETLSFFMFLLNMKDNANVTNQS